MSFRMEGPTVAEAQCRAVAVLVHGKLGDLVNLQTRECRSFLCIKS